MRVRPGFLTAALLVLIRAGSVAADVANVQPQATNWTGFVDEIGNTAPDEIATGSLTFALFGADARGFARFPLTTIPAGSAVTNVRLQTYACNHDNVLSGTACAKVATLGACAVDPLAATVAQTWNAVAAGPVYTTLAIPRTGPSFCLDFFVPFDIDLGPLAVADVQAALVQGWVAIGLRSDIPCDPTSDHVDWLGFSETIVGGDPGCLVSQLPGSRMTLVITYDPPCASGFPTPIAPAGNICLGDAFDLDGSTSTGCPVGGFLYRWLDGPTAICPWSPAATCNVSPTGTTSYTLEVACATSPACTASLTVPVTVSQQPVPAAPPGDICAGGSFDLDASTSTGCPIGGYLYRWLDGPAVVCGWSAAPTCSVSPTSTTSYTLEVACASAPTCIASQTVDVAVAQQPVPAAPGGSICAGASYNLDGSTSTGCPVGGYLYRWLSGPAVVCGWSATPTCAVAPPTTTTYTLEVACAASPSCTASSTASVTVDRAPVAAATGAAVCENLPFLLSGSGSTGCPSGGYLFRWLDGPTVVCGWSATPTCSVTPAATTVYTLEVACAASPSCIDTEPVTVTTRNCTLAVRWDTYSASYVLAAEGPTVQVRFRTLEEIDTSHFAVERALAETGPFEPVGIVDARGAGFPYQLEDASGRAGSLYRIVEYTSDGRGDVSPVFHATDGTRSLPRRVETSGARGRRGSER